MNTVFLIDGFNFYHSIAELAPKYHWLNYYSFCKNFLTKNDTIAKVVLFTAEAYWLEDKVKRHRVLLEANKFFNVEVVLGKFKEKHVYCKKCRTSTIHHEEKYTDVNIALEAYRQASKKEIDQVIIITGDTDLVPAVKAIKSDFPNKKVCVIFPYKKHNAEFKEVADCYYKTTLEKLTNHIMPRVIERKDKKPIICPEQWIKEDNK
ncbi:MAG: NYN domain-containing protein [Succinivibrio sp.]|nr:NYN domain-containing protein [Succinivibrio sp.]